MRFPIVGVMGPVANGQSVHPAVITSSDENTAGLMDASVYPEGPPPGLIGRCNVTIFPDLQTPHPAAGVPLFDSYEHAHDAAESYAKAGMKFVCAYHTQEEVAVEKIVDQMRSEMAAHAKELTAMVQKHLPETADVFIERGKMKQEFADREIACMKAVQQTLIELMTPNG
jgi:hypothetical protein